MSGREGSSGVDDEVAVVGAGAGPIIAGAEDIVEALLAAGAIGEAVHFALRQQVYSERLI